MNPVTGYDVSTENSYRRQRITAEMGTSRRHRNPVRRVGRALIDLHHRLEVV